jgi:exonuclease SbcC
MNDPKLAISIKKDALKKQGQMRSELEGLQSQHIEKKSVQLELITSISRFSSLESQFKAINEELRTLKPAYEEYQQNIRIAGLVAERMNDLGKAVEALETKSGELKTIEDALEVKKGAYDAKSHAEARGSCDRLAAEIASVNARIESEAERLMAIERDLAAIEKLLEEMAGIKEKLSSENDYLAFVDRARDIIRMAGPEVIRVYIDLISREATDMYCEIAGDRRFNIRWTPDYDILLMEDGRERIFRQLSGGEQMSAALAVRLAVLKILTSSDVVFLDEPTQNLDESRRERLALEILRIKDFRQMVIISHDDAFNATLENVIEIEKVNGESKVRRRAGHAGPQTTLQ